MEHVNCTPQHVVRDSGWDQIRRLQAEDRQRASAQGDCDLFSDSERVLAQEGTFFNESIFEEERQK